VYLVGGGVGTHPVKQAISHLFFTVAQGPPSKGQEAQATANSATHRPAYSILHNRPYEDDENSGNRNEKNSSAAGELKD